MHIVLSHDFFPMIGGAHAWLYEVYQRWPQPVTLVTERPPATADRAVLDAFDRATPSLRIDRAEPPIGALDLKRPPVVVALLAQARRLVRRTRGAPSVLHLLRAFPEGAVGLLARGLSRGRTALVTYAHGEELVVATSSRQLAWLARQVYARSQVVIANSANTARLVGEICPTARVSVVHPGVDVAKFAPTAAAAAYRAQWGFPEGTVVVGTLARMEPRKNQAAVLRAVARLRERGRPVAAVIGGGGDERPALERLAGELGLGAAVRFAGVIAEADKAAFYQACDVFALPSVRSGLMIEGFGIVFLEAAASGVPTIAGSSGGERDAVVDGTTGFVVDGRELDAVTAALETLVTDDDRRAGMRRAAVAWAAEHDWSAVVGRTLTVLADAGLPVAEGAA